MIWYSLTCNNAWFPKTCAVLCQEGLRFLPLIPFHQGITGFHWMKNSGFGLKHFKRNKAMGNGPGMTPDRARVPRKRGVQVVGGGRCSKAARLYFYGGTEGV